MITKDEISIVSSNLGLSLDVVEKDYVLGWVLAGINQDKELRDNWVFKGGTCLKKCFFKVYRFSEDLDFTLIDEAQLNPELLASKFNVIAEWIYENSGIELALDKMDFNLYQNPRGKISVMGKLSYHGPIRRRNTNNLPRVKLDLTADEALVTKPIRSIVDHSYSDLEEELFYINSYSYPEVFAEKIRALVERCLPRDLYDVAEIYKRKDMRPKAQDLLNILSKKCEFKGIGLPNKNLMKDEDRAAELRGSWDDMLKHQLRDLPPLDQYLSELEDVLAWLNS